MDQLEISNLIVVQGIRGKGRNRVREHGSSWFVVGKLPEKIIIQSEHTGYVRSMVPNDPDFMINETWP
jgi:hypothetical protein